MLAQQLRNAHRDDPRRAPWPEGPISTWQIHNADLRYARGPGAFAELRRRALKAGYSDDIAGWQQYARSHWPHWTSEDTFFHARAAALMSHEAGGTRRTARERLPGTMTASAKKPSAKPDQGEPWPLFLGILGAFFFFSRRR